MSPIVFILFLGLSIVAADQAREKQLDSDFGGSDSDQYSDSEEFGKITEGRTFRRPFGRPLRRPFGGSSEESFEGSSEEPFEGPFGRPVFVPLLRPCESSTGTTPTSAAPASSTDSVATIEDNTSTTIGEAVSIV